MRLRWLLLLFGLAGCQEPNAVALKLGAPPESAVKLRSFEMRRFDTTQGATQANVLLLAGAATLQDLGFTITESAPDVGVLVASKQRDAKEFAQVAGQVALAIGLMVLGAPYSPTWDETQSIHVTLVISPDAGGRAEQARVSFDRYITNNHGELWRTELVDDPKIYQEFYDRMSQAIHIQSLDVGGPSS